MIKVDNNISDEEFQKAINAIATLEAWKNTPKSFIAYCHRCREVHTFWDETDKECWNRFCEVNKDLLSDKEKGL